MDEIIITKFLDKNYKVITNVSEFVICDCDSFQQYNGLEFIDLFKKIIGEFITVNGESSVDLVHKWFETTKRKLTKIIVDYFDTLDESVGSNLLAEQVMMKFVDDKQYSHVFIVDFFNDYYTKKHLNPRIDKYLESFDKRKFSGDLTSEFDKYLITDSTYHHEYSMKYLNQWYSDVVLEDKVKDFLSQLVVTLGRTNWIVTWIGHGPIKNETIKTYFKKENSAQLKYINEMFNNWYERAKQDSSEKLMKGIEVNRSQTINQALERNM